MHTAFALAQAAKVQAFNETFYSVAATIIPVLFLALAVQGPFLGELLSLAERLGARSSPPSRAPMGTYAADAPWRIAAWIVIYSTIGEILAIVALYQQHAIEYGDSITLTGVLLLVVATALKPALAVFGPRKAPARGADSDPEPGKPDASLEAEYVQSARIAGYLNVLVAVVLVVSGIDANAHSPSGVHPRRRPPSG